MVVVTSGAIAAGWTTLAPDRPRPTDLATLQAVAAVGQHRLMQVWSDALGRHGLTAGQVLLAPLDFVHRSQYLHARQTLARLLELGVVPVVNENDAVADDEIRFGDNDRLAALVAHLVGADLLVLLTDTAGLLTEDPRRTDAGLAHRGGGRDRPRARADRRGPGQPRWAAAGWARSWPRPRSRCGRGWRRSSPTPPAPAVLAAVTGSAPGVGTRFRPQARRLPARKLWIAFAVGASGTIVVDAGARRALVERGRSLLPAGVVVGPGRRSTSTTPWRSPVPTAPSSPRAWSARTPPRWPRGPAGGPTSCPRTPSREVVHRDDLVVLD